MSYNFAISRYELRGYEHSVKINEEFSFYYDTKEYLTSVSKSETELICYGYCFDVREPKTHVKDTLANILSKESINNELNFLNGQYILIIINGEKVNISIDATSLIPVYYSESKKLITNDVNHSSLEKISIEIMNPILKFELNTFQFFRDEPQPTSLDNGQIEQEIIKLVENQHIYFGDKEFTVQFKSNNYSKTLLSILQPSLFNNYISISGNDITDKNKKYGQLIAKEFRMKFLQADIENLKEIIHSRNAHSNLYIAKNNLFAFKNFNDNKTTKVSNKKQNYEMNIMHRKRGQSVELAKIGLLYDPFNVRQIQHYLVEYDETNDFNPITLITKTLHPSLNYYDFASDGTLTEINRKLKKQVEQLKENKITAKNQKFLLDTKASDFRVSDNLDGRLKDDGILVHPGSQKIKKNDDFVIIYKNPGEGLIYIESFCKDKEQSQYIKLDINGELYNLDEFLDGALINIESVINLAIKYEKDFNSLKWQKAGTILVRKM